MMIFVTCPAYILLLFRVSCERARDGAIHVGWGFEYRTPTTAKHISWTSNSAWRLREPNVTLDSSNLVSCSSSLGYPHRPPPYSSTFWRENRRRRRLLASCRVLREYSLEVVATNERPKRLRLTTPVMRRRHVEFERIQTREVSRTFSRSAASSGGQSCRNLSCRELVVTTTFARERRQADIRDVTSRRLVGCRAKTLIPTILLLGRKRTRIAFPFCVASP